MKPPKHWPKPPAWMKPIPPIVEYYLPRPELPAEVRAELAPWMSQVADADPPMIMTMLEKRWKSIASPPQIELRDQLLSYTPLSIVIQEQRAWLRLARGIDSGVPIDDDPECLIGATIFVPPPCNGDELNHRLQAHGIAPDSEFHSFMHHFAGMREDIDTDGSFIELEDQWHKIEEIADREMIDNFDEWSGALVIYAARNSDRLLLHPSGRVGWWKFAEGRATSDFLTFSAMIRFYVAFRKQEPYPFDSYPPRSHRYLPDKSTQP